MECKELSIKIKRLPYRHELLFVGTPKNIGIIMLHQAKIESGRSFGC
jgi:hypothetical protein